jgi:ligand-binding sensor domain-containing protein
MRTLILFFLTLLVSLNSLMAEDPERYTPAAIEIKKQPFADKWTEWRVIPEDEPFREDALITSSTLDDVEQLWIGTNTGKLLKYKQGKWTQEVGLRGTQITGIAVSTDIVWLSTNDGIVRLQHPKENTDSWEVSRSRNYYQGHPAFVSGGYISGTDSSRLWGHVDGIFVSRYDTAYSPSAISEEHGLYSWSNYGVWHQFMPHYWGANSPWLDTAELIPHRRPTAMTEDRDGNLWIATEGDGLIRMNAKARKYHERDREHNAKDGTEWTRFQSQEIGCELFRVNDVSASQESGVWVSLTSLKKEQWIGRYHGDQWDLFEMPKISRQTFQGKQVVQTQTWQAVASSVCEFSPRRVLVGARDSHAATGLYEFDLTSKTFTRCKEIKHDVRDVLVTPAGECWVRSWYGLFYHPTGELSSPKSNLTP